VVAYLLAATTAAALVTDGVVHFKDAYFYDANTGALLSQGQLFRSRPWSPSWRRSACWPSRRGGLPGCSRPW
jgi:hypothetical protein